MNSHPYARRRIIVWHIALTCLGGALIVMPWSAIAGTESGLYCCCIFATAIVPWMCWTWMAKGGSIFDPYSVCLVSAILFSLSYCVLYVFNMTGGTFLGGKFDYEQCIGTVGAATVGIMSMHLGALVRRGFKRQRPATVARGNVSSHGATVVGGLLIALAIIPAAIHLRELLTFAMSNAYASVQEAAGTGVKASVRILATFMGPASFYFLVGRPQSRVRIVIAGAFTSITAATLMFTGDRSDATMELIAFLWLYEKAVKRIPRRLLVTGAVVLLTLFPLIRINRALTGAERLAPLVWEEALSQVDNPVRSSMAEMGGSLAVTAHVINLVPSARPFGYGSSYLWAIASIVPNISGGLHPSQRHSLSAWLINITDTYGAAHGGGAGFSFLAEAYLNFGWFGIVAIPMLIGIVLSEVTNWAALTHIPAGWAAVACLLEVMPKFARAESLEAVRWVAWMCFGLYFACTLIERRRMRRTSFAVRRRIATPFHQVMGIAPSSYTAIGRMSGRE